MSSAKRLRVATPFREASGSYVINIDEEKEGTEDGTLWHSRNYSCFGGCSTINYNMLPPVVFVR